MPVHEALEYVLGAYSVFVVLLVVYGVVMATRMARVRRELAAASRWLEDGEP